MASRRVAVLALALVAGAACASAAVTVSEMAPAGALTSKDDSRSLPLSGILSDVLGANGVVVLSDELSKAQGLPNALRSAGSWNVFTGPSAPGGVRQAISTAMAAHASTALGDCSAFLQSASPEEASPESLESTASELSRSRQGSAVVCHEGGNDDSYEWLAVLQQVAKTLPVAVLPAADAVAVASSGSFRTLAAVADAGAGVAAAAVFDAAYAARLGSNTTEVCDAHCHTQVYYLQAIIVGIVILMTLGVGITCMHIIGTPTQWNTPKDSGRHAHHE